MLKETFTNLLNTYTSNKALIAELWAEIETNYAHQKRHYHTLKHLDHLLKQLTAIQTKIQQWDTVLFSLYYHDVIYNSLKSDNEEKSAELAEKRMKQLAVPHHIIEACKEQILATKAHVTSTDSDTNYFTDADLSILGQDWDTYANYYKQVRKEYTVYPNLIYNPGRKKVLAHFLAMDRIFKTDFFYQQFEQQAKQNLEQEISLLS